MDMIGRELYASIKESIKAKLVELDAYVDNELPEYIMIMVANQKNQRKMTDDLSLFLNEKTEAFTTWLVALIKKLNLPMDSDDEVDSDGNVIKPTKKETKKVPQEKEKKTPQQSKALPSKSDPVKVDESESSTARKSHKPTQRVEDEDKDTKKSRKRIPITAPAPTKEKVTKLDKEISNKENKEAVISDTEEKPVEKRTINSKPKFKPKEIIVSDATDEEPESRVRSRVRVKRRGSPDNHNVVEKNKVSSVIEVAHRRHKSSKQDHSVKVQNNMLKMALSEANLSYSNYVGQRSGKNQSADGKSAKTGKASTADDSAPAPASTTDAGDPVVKNSTNGDHLSDDHSRRHRRKHAKLEVKETEERMTAELEQHEIETKDLRLKLANLENDHKKYIEEMESNYEDKVLTRISKVQEIHDREMESQRVLHKQLLQQQLESRQQLQAQYQANLDKAIDREASLKVLMDEYKVAKEQSQLKCSNLQDDIIELNTKHNDEFSKIKLKYDQLNENYQENILELEKQKKVLR